MRYRSGWIAILAGLLPWAVGQAAGIDITVLDASGKPLPEVVVVAIARNAAPPAAPGKVPQAIMDQINRQFVPQVLVVQTGTPVAFPNSDSVAHQVYSFSRAKRFQLALYHGHAHPPLVFDQPGLVVLGCNIHDDMVGYIYVTPSPWFGKTAPDGKLALDNVPGGAFAISIWSPRLNEAEADEVRTLELSEATRGQVTFKLRKALLPEPRPKPSKANWDDY